MGFPLYEGSHRAIFELFLELVGDDEAQMDALLDLTSWEDTRSLLSIGGGEGIVEATLLRQCATGKDLVSGSVTGAVSSIPTTSETGKSSGTC